PRPFMTLIRFDQVSLDFGDQAILHQADFAIDTGERVCLIGRNGAGKTTTLKLITGEVQPEHGEIVRKSELVVSQLAQSLPPGVDASVRQVVASGLSGVRALLNEYETRSQEMASTEAMRELEELHQLIDIHGGWSIDQRIDAILTELDLPGERRMSELSGGWRRRVALATALVQKPDLLLLDEPTNHLDIVTIKWLENIVYSYDGAVLFITHDRAFLQRLATRIVEIDLGRLESWPGDYANFLQRKEKALEDEAAEHERFDKELQQEEVWIRKGIKARRTRNEGRARALQRMREERARRVTREQAAQIQIEEADRTGRQVIRAKNVTYRFDDRPLIENFSTRIVRGDRIGILGNNGVGKTTLLRILLGELEPQSGTVKHGTNLETGYFDQLRESLDPEKSVIDNVAGGRTHVAIGGGERHVIGYLKGFLFSPKRARMPVKALSGGERNRVILAKLFTRAANLLVLDEPTNDLDMETLEVLEEKLTSFSGTLIVVSHDRQFLDNVVTSTIVFEADGGIREYVGGYSDWLRQGKELAEVDNLEPVRATRENAREQTATRSPTKLSYREQRELENLPKQIEDLESELAALEETVATPDFYSRHNEVVQDTLRLLSEKRSLIDAAIQRWSELEDRQQQLRKR
ncbi:MAG TPA: ATP-binding cassette domain-containing protein, partial [Woeseiaceae bacterium]|nr:ATP-binding cassette domain-containing protein [Woeseiaceae bacterium]